MPDRTQLNLYSRRFSDVLFAEFPGWEAGLNVDPWPGADPGCFVVTIASPADPLLALWVGTDNGEITVGFGESWHDHHGAWTGATEAESFRDALEQIRGIVGERLVLAVARRGEDAQTTTLLEPGERPAFGSDDVTRYDLYSWRGTYSDSIPT